MVLTHCQCSCNLFFQSCHSGWTNRWCCHSTCCPYTRRITCASNFAILVSHIKHSRRTACHLNHILSLRQSCAIDIRRWCWLTANAAVICSSRAVILVGLIDDVATPHVAPTLEGSLVLVILQLCGFIFCLLLLLMLLLRLLLPYDIPLKFRVPRSKLS
jgi:hypothetical protein